MNKHIKAPDRLTVEQIQSIPETAKITIISYLEVSEKIRDVTALFRLIMSADQKMLMQKGITDISQEIDIKKILQNLPYPTNYAMQRLLGNVFIQKDNEINL